MPAGCLRSSTDNTSSLKTIHLKSATNGRVNNVAARRHLHQWLSSSGGIHWHTVIFNCLCVLVAVISVHDALLVVVNHEVIGTMEQNPAGRWLLAIQGGEVWLFVFVKLAMTALVCVLLIGLYEHWRRGGLLVVAGVASFQTLLLCYLTLL